MPPGATAVGGPPARPRRTGKMLAMAAAAVILLLVLCGVGAALLYRSTNSADDARAGACLTGDSIDQDAETTAEVDLKTVGCDEDTAKYKVIGRVDDKREDEATDEVCDPFPDAEFIYWEGPKGKTGFVLCLATNA